jgi:site-specific recombinase XerD
VKRAGLLLRDSGEEGLKTKRDRALLCLLLGAGLRREEIVSLDISHVQQREGRWVIADLIGKRKRIRTVAIPGMGEGGHRLAHKGKALIEQIQIALGHDSIQTTERYLGVRQDLTDAPCDHLGIEFEEE